MMKNKIPVALVFCLVAVSVSLAQPLVDQDVSNGWQSYTVEMLKIAGGEDPDRISCFYIIHKCVIEGEVSEQTCDITTDEEMPAIEYCPEPTSKNITLKRTGENELSYNGLQLKNPTHVIPESAEGTIKQLNIKSYVQFTSPFYTIFLRKN
eukprot:Nk52_evm1s2394 gene=Nk52_evmTU1s2394